MAPKKSTTKKAVAAPPDEVPAVPKLCPIFPWRFTVAAPSVLNFGLYFQRNRPPAQDGT